MKNKVVIAGVGPGSKDLISLKAREAIEQGDVLIGGRRNLDSFARLDRETIEIKNNLAEILDYIEKKHQEKKIVVLASGDPFLFGIGSYLFRHKKEIELEVIPGISAMQYLCAKTGRRSEDLFLCSVHGMKQNLAAILSEQEKIGLFLGKEPEKVLCSLTEQGFGFVSVVVGENLSYEDEKITRGTVEELSHFHFSDLSVMILEKKESEKKETEQKKEKEKEEKKETEQKKEKEEKKETEQKKEQETEQKKEKEQWDFTTPGIPDQEFIRGEVPMTKEEIRACTLSKLKLKKDSHIWDIGAGTGSVTVECALCSPDGVVTAFEKNPEAVALIRKNCEKFCLNNVRILEGQALDALKKENQKCDRAFIGGAGRQLKEILTLLAQQSDIRVVVNSITLETTYEAMKWMQELAFEQIECIHVTVSKSVTAGQKHLMKTGNTITIISGEKGKI